MGRIIGFTFTLAAIVSLLQYPAALYADQSSSSSSSGTADGGGDHFILVNSIMLGICIVPIAMLVWYDRRTSQLVDDTNCGDYERNNTFDTTAPSPRVSTGMLLSSPGSGLRNSLRQVQRLRKDSSI